MKNRSKFAAEKLNDDNAFPKMKILPEYDGDFKDRDTTITPELIDIFRRQVMELEKQASNPVYIKVYDKIDRPKHFKPVIEIPDNEIEASWLALLNYLKDYNIELNVCSPNVNARELYRFTTEELFHQKMADTNTPGIVNCFIYDEFHPDPVYDNTRAIEEDLLPGIFSSNHSLFNFWFAMRRLTLNGRKYEHFDDLKRRIEAFKLCFDHMQLKKVNTYSCVVNKTNTMAQGDYQFSASLGSLETCYKGKWKVKFLRDELG